MIVKGKSCSHAGNLGNYLLRLNENDAVAFIGAEGTLSQDLKGALAEMAGIAQGTNCKNFLYHASIRPMNGEHLTPEQWARAVDILAEALGLQGHQRIVVMHDKDGTQHAHVVFNRIDLETMKAQKMGWNYVQHEKAERQMEREFGLAHVQGRFVSHEGEPLAKHGPTQDEMQQGERSGVNVYAWRREIRQIEQRAQGGPDLVAALEKGGHFLAKGDKAALLILDPAGNPHRAAQSLGLRVKGLQSRLEGVDLAKLPSVEEAQAKQREAAKLADLKRELLETAGAVSKKGAPTLTTENVQQLRRGQGYGLLKAMGETEKRRIEWKQDKPAFLDKIKAASASAADSLDFMVQLQDGGLQLARHVVQTGGKQNGKEWLVAVAPRGQEIAVDKMMRPDLLADLKEQQKNGLIVSTSDQVRDDLRTAERRAKSEKRKADFQEVRDIKKELWEKRVSEFFEAEKKRSGHKAAILYSRGDMAGQQRDALKHHKDVLRKKEQAAEQQRREEQQTKAAEQRRAQDEQRKKQTPAEQRREEKKARTEQTDRNSEKTQDVIMRELFEKRFGDGNKTREAIERERLRER